MSDTTGFLNIIDQKVLNPALAELRELLII